MFVDAGLLHSGAIECHRAGGHAQNAANQLARGPLLAGMFGEFWAARTFQDAVMVAHTRHARNLRTHQEILVAVGDQAHRASAEFTGMEERNTAQLRMARCNFAI